MEQAQESWCSLMTLKGMFQYNGSLEQRHAKLGIALCSIINISATVTDGYGNSLTKAVLPKADEDNHSRPQDSVQMELTC